MGIHVEFFFQNHCLLGAFNQLLWRAGIGLYNIIHWDWTILRAFSPHYWVLFLVHEGQDGWRLLGSIVLCITGAPRCLNIYGRAPR